MFPAVLLLPVFSLLVDAWEDRSPRLVDISGRARNHDRSSGPSVTAVLRLACQSCVAPARQHIVSLLGNPQLSAAIVATGSPSLPAAGLMLMITALLAWFVLSRVSHHPFYAYEHALEVLRWRRLVLGMVLMSYLRLLVPRRDFFLQAPFFSWAPVLAVGAVVFTLVPIRPLAFAISMLLVAVFVPMWVNNIAPPLWLFLGTSENESFRAFWDLRLTWQRHGLTLLDRTSSGGQQFYDEWRSQIDAPHVAYDPGVGRVWSLRTRPGVWTFAVHVLAAFVPVIVVDWRDPSEIVKFEAEWLVNHGFAGKTYFLAPADVPATSANVPVAGNLVNENMLIAARWTDTGLSGVPSAMKPKLS